MGELGYRVVRDVSVSDDGDLLEVPGVFATVIYVIIVNGAVEHPGAPPEDHDTGGGLAGQVGDDGGTGPGHVSPNKDGV